MPPAPVTPCSVTGLVLAGGLGTRMGGVDKGLQALRGTPLAQHALQRLRTQSGPWLGALALNANRHLPTYQAMGVPVWPDTVPGHAGPLAGFLTGLTHCTTPWLLTVPCDTPGFPSDLLARLVHALGREGADMALASAPDEHGCIRPQPVFCLMPVALRSSLVTFLAQGGRKVGAWAAQHRAVHVPFGPPGDDARAFFNANTLADLQALQT